MPDNIEFNDQPGSWDPEMQRLMALTQAANVRAQLATTSADSAMAEAQKYLKLWEAAARARGLDPDLYQRPWSFHLAERHWLDTLVGPGIVKTRLDILENRGLNDEGPFVKLELSWAGENQQPECWEIQWTHYLSWLSLHLENYLFRYSPVPREMLTTFLGSLTPDWRSYFEKESDALWSSLGIKQRNY
jgi:hypothetical protein